jgi:hypothetical protein
MNGLERLSPTQARIFSLTFFFGAAARNCLREERKYLFVLLRLPTFHAGGMASESLHFFRFVAAAKPERRPKTPI